jgi:hypothetical protein
MTAAEIYYSISSRSVTREVGIKLIENYGICQKRNAITEMHSDLPILRSKELEEIENVIKSMTVKLDELFEKVAEACKRK